MITPRFRLLANGEYSCYLDAYVQGKRTFKFLGIRFKKDYSPLFAKHRAKVENVKIHPDDIEKFKVFKTLQTHKCNTFSSFKEYHSLLTSMPTKRAYCLRTQQ